MQPKNNNQSPQAIPELPRPVVEMPQDRVASQAESSVGESSMNPSRKHATAQPAPQDPSTQLSPQQPIAPPVDPVQSTSTSAQPITTGPASAKDSDRIEKEWVKRAESVVASTKNDPYEQERQVSHLQVDYLKKRFGKDLSVPE